MKVNELKCKYCGNELFLGGSDHDLEDGCYHAYWLCKKCGAGAVEKVRYGKRVSVLWQKGENDYSQDKNEKNNEI